MDEIISEIVKLELPNFDDPFQNMEFQLMGNEVQTRKLDACLEGIEDRKACIDAILTEMMAQKTKVLSSYDEAIRTIVDAKESLKEVDQILEDLKDAAIKFMGDEEFNSQTDRVIKLREGIAKQLDKLFEQESTAKFIIEHMEKNIHWISALQQEGPLTKENCLSATKYLWGAAALGCKNLSAFCIENGANLNATNLQKKNILFVAAESLHPNACNIIAQLVTAGISVNSACPVALGINMTPILQLLINRDSLKPVEHKKQIETCDEIINFLFASGANLPKYLSEKGEKLLESILTEESRIKRSCAEGKSYNILYDKNSNDCDLKDQSGAGRDVVFDDRPYRSKKDRCGIS